VVSPRLSSYGGGSSIEHRIDPAAVEAFVFSERAVFTFVVTGPADLDEISALEHCYSLYPIWVAPEGATPGQVLSGLPWLADAVIDRGWHLSGRLQVLLQGDQPTPEHPSHGRPTPRHTGLTRRHPGIESARFLVEGLPGQCGVGGGEL